MQGGGGAKRQWKKEEGECPPRVPLSRLQHEICADYWADPDLLAGSRDCSEGGVREARERVTQFPLSRTERENRTPGASAAEGPRCPPGARDARPCRLRVSTEPPFSVRIEARDVFIFILGLRPPIK